MKVKLASIVLCICLFSNAHAAEEETVVLLHGIAQSSLSMYPLQQTLEKNGYDVINIGYNSTAENISDLTKTVKKRIHRSNPYARAKKTHFVTHSMGGLIIRQYLKEYRGKIPANKLGRVVMLAPPNSGSEVADTLQGLKPYQFFFGPAGQDLTTDAQNDKEYEIYYDLGIIAGKKGWPYFVANAFLPGENDGRVTVESTKIDGMSDHTVVEATHSFITMKPSVHKQVLHFLKEGSFKDKATIDREPTKHQR